MLFIKPYIFFDYFQIFNFHILLNKVLCSLLILFQLFEIKQSITFFKINIYVKNYLNLSIF